MLDRFVGLPLLKKKNKNLQDPGNIDGGKLILRVRKELSSRLWEDLVRRTKGEGISFHWLQTLFAPFSCWPSSATSLMSVTRFAGRSCPCADRKTLSRYGRARPRIGRASFTLGAWRDNRRKGFCSMRLAHSDVLKSVLGLPTMTRVEYKEHNQSLQDKSSFRNAGVFQ